VNMSPPALALIFAAAASPALAMDSAEGLWAITDRVGGKLLTIECRFTQDGNSLAGDCVDGEPVGALAKGGRSHPITKGAISGDQFVFVYRSNFLIGRFNNIYSGRLNGDELSGTVWAGAAITLTGRRLGVVGPFTGTRVGP